MSGNCQRAEIESQDPGAPVRRDGYGSKGEPGDRRYHWFMATTIPVLFHDPTSEPSRAVHWFCLAAGISIRIEHVWLTRGEHRSRRLLEVNPRHQVPALAHDGFCLSETTAILAYLAELGGCSGRWFGDCLHSRARIQMLLSWYHTNLRLKITLRYLLPFLLMPAYHGRAHAPAEEVVQARADFAEVLDQLDAFLDPGPFVSGDQVTVPDLLFAAEMFALDVDVARDSYLGAHLKAAAWLERMRSVAGYEESHRAWNHVVPMIIEQWRVGENEGADPGWVATKCLEVVSARTLGSSR